MLDIWTALLSGIMQQQWANDPGGDRWKRLLDDVIDHVPRVREEAAVVMQATEFCRVPSGRGDGEGPLALEVPF